MSVRPHPCRDNKDVAARYRNAWIIDYYYKGKRHQETFRGSEGEALLYHAELKKNLRRTPTIDYTFNDLLVGWKDYYRNNQLESTYTDMLFCLKKLVPFFGNRYIDQIDMDAVERYKAGRMESVSKRTINKELSYLSSCLRWAFESGKIKAPVQIVGFRKVKTKKPQPLNENEINELLKHIPEHLRLAVLLMVDGGLRKEEALNVKRENILDKMIFVQGKGEKERVVPIASKRLQEAIDNAPQEGYLTVNMRTGKPYTTIRKPLKAAGNKIGRHVSHHTLRHSYGTFLASKMVPLANIQELMGHSDPKITRIYAQLAANVLKQSLEGVFND